MAVSDDRLNDVARDDTHESASSGALQAVGCAAAGVLVAFIERVLQSTSTESERRMPGPDRRRRTRSGRRYSDPHVSDWQWRWRRIAWIFAAYAAYLSLRSVPETLRRLFRREGTPT